MFYHETLQLIDFATALVCTEVALLLPRPLKYSSATTNSLLAYSYIASMPFSLVKKLGKESIFESLYCY
ncbi:hypothetical protein EI94DRAFT_1743584 [Lactarius quietus]|nr:hypothetical protein EI94DRAFT_1743584 [Lactarius quietus]